MFHTTNIWKLLLIVLLALAVSADYSHRVSAEGQGHWRILTPTNPPSPRYGHSLTTLPDGKVLLFGGENSSQDMYNDLYSYDNGQWGPITPASPPPTPRKGHSTWYINGKVYVHGGKGKSQAMGDLWSYDVASREWKEVQTTGLKPQPRHSHTATVLQDGSVLLLGGMDFSGLSFPDLWKLNPDNTYTPLAPAPLSLADHVAQLVENKLFVFGDPHEVLIYDITNNQWETHESAPPLWGGATSAVRQNDAGQTIVMLFGGIKKNEYESDLVYEYNTATRTPSQRPENMPFTYSYGSSATLVQQEGGPWKVLFFGGKSGGEVIGTTFEFSLDTPLQEFRIYLPLILRNQ